MSFAEACNKAGLVFIAVLAMQTFGTITAHAASHPPARAARRQSSLARIIVRLSLKYHYPAVRLDAELSHRVLSRYIDILDPGHFYFTRKDVESIHATFDSHLAKDLRIGNLEPAYAIRRIYLQRKRRLFSLAVKLLDEKPDLNSTKHYRVNRTDAPLPQDNLSQVQLWKERIENEVLNRLLQGGSLDSAIASLKAYYRDPGAGTNDNAFDQYINAFMSALDPHSRYITAQKSGNRVDGTSMAQVIAGGRLVNRNGYVTLVRPPISDNVQDNGGLINGDRILGIQMKPGGRTIPLSGWNLDSAIDTISQSAGTLARLLVQPPGPPGLQHTKWVRVSAHAAQYRTPRVAAYIDFARDGIFQYKIGVIRIPSFYDGIESDVAYLLRLLESKGVSAILLDMRNNPGGSLRGALALAGLFMPDNEPIVDIQTRFGNSLHPPLNGNGGMVWRGPLGILVNRGSASATEMFCGAMKDYGRAIIIGARTWGKGTIQTFIPLAEHTHVNKPGELKLTTAEFSGPNGKSPQLRGILPDMILPSATNIFTEGEIAYSDALPKPTDSPIRTKPLPDDLVAPLPLLKAYFRKHLLKNKRLQLYEREIALLRKTDSNSYVSLDLAKRRHSVTESDAQWLKLYNEWRAAAGNPPLDNNEQAHEGELRIPDIPLRLGIRVMGEFAGSEPSIGFETHMLDMPAQASQCGYHLYMSVTLSRLFLNPCSHNTRQVLYTPPARSSGKAVAPMPRPRDGGRL